jgi:tetrahydromethanopterin S-methyltransferase subunit G
MERARVSWTDERLDDLNRRVDAGFTRVDADLRSINERMDEGFRAVNSRIDALGTQLAASQRTMIQMLGGVIGVSVITLITVLASGA